MTRFSSLSEHCTKDPLWFHSTQQLEKLRWIEVAGNKEEDLFQYLIQGLPVSDTVGMIMVPGDQLCRGPQQLLPLKKPTDSLWISLVFAPEVFAFTKDSCLSPSLLPTFLPLP